MNGQQHQFSLSDDGEINKDETYSRKPEAAKVGLRISSARFSSKCLFLRQHLPKVSNAM